MQYNNPNLNLQLQVRIYLVENSKKIRRNESSSPLKDLGFDFQSSNNSQIIESAASSFHIDSNLIEMTFPESQKDNQEFMAFYRYITDIMYSADTEFVYLFDILQEYSNRETASQAFFNSLVLASKGFVRIEQNVAYGDIIIRKE
jgi:hypothetical protein